MALAASPNLLLERVFAQNIELKEIAAGQFAEMVVRVDAADALQQACGQLIADAGQKGIRRLGAVPTADLGGLCRQTVSGDSYARVELANSATGETAVLLLGSFVFDIRASDGARAFLDVIIDVADGSSSIAQITLTNNFFDEAGPLSQMGVYPQVNRENRFFVDVGRWFGTSGINAEIAWYHYWWYDSHHHPWWWYGAYWWWWWRYSWFGLGWIWWWDWFWVWWHWQHWYSWSTWWGDLIQNPLQLSGGSGGSGGGSGGGRRTGSPWPSGASSPTPGGGGTGTGAGPVAGGGGGTTGGTPPPVSYIQGNDVQYLIDGDTVYKRVSDLLKDVADHAGGNGYVHMRFWECVSSSAPQPGVPSVDTFLEPGVTFKSRITDVARGGNEVRILLWSPGRAEQIAGLGEVYDANQRCKAELEAIDPVHIKVELVEHPNYDGALHTKTMIFCNGDGVRTIVGGLNMANAYRDQQPHAVGSHWHDAAVEFVGPAVTDVEKDFTKHWPTSAGPVKGPLASPAAGTMSIRVAVTDVGQADLRQELLDRINGAEQYVYMENYSIHDPDLINALAVMINIKRLSRTPFYPILVIPDPRLSGPIYSWLHYVTYVALSIRSSSACTYNQGGVQKTVTRAADGLQKWSFDPGWYGSWYEKSEFTWDTGHVSIKDIVSFQNDTPLYRKVYCSATPPPTFQYIMVHSKVALFDDQFAAIGSANFAPHSMKLDNELTSFITSGSAMPVLPFRRALWDEHFPGSGGGFPPSEWSTRAAANAAAVARGSVVVNQAYILPIDISEYSKTEPPQGVLNLLFDAASRW